MRRFFVLILFLLALCGSMAKNAMVEEQEVASLERQLSGKKHKMKIIRRMIATAPEKKKVKLVQEEKGLMLDCKKLREKIERTKAKLTRLSLKYKNECIKKMISKIKKSEKKLKVQKLKLKKLKQKIILMKKTLKVAPPKSKPRLIRKLKKAVDVFVKRACISEKHSD